MLAAFLHCLNSNMCCKMCNMLDPKSVTSWTNMCCYSVVVVMCGLLTSGCYIVACFYKLFLRVLNALIKGCYLGRFESLTEVIWLWFDWEIKSGKYQNCSLEIELVVFAVVETRLNQGSHIKGCYPSFLVIDHHWYSSRPRVVLSSSCEVLFVNHSLSQFHKRLGVSDCTEGLYSTFHVSECLDHCGSDLERGRTFLLLRGT